MPTTDRTRWAVLGVLCLSLLIVGIDGTIVNVALPTLVRDLDATSSELQWIVDAYTIVFAGLLLLAGNTGDRHGRKSALLAGLVVFGVGSVASAFSGTADVLIATRALQGLGAAFIMPTTLSILTNVFADPSERTRAIAIWAGVSGLGVAVGPVTGGFLLEHFWWGSVFLVNVPVVLATLALVVWLVPASKDPTSPRLDLLGTVLVTAGLILVLYGIIEGPNNGWTSATILASFAIGAILLVAFALWELRTDHPILDLTFFANPRFTAASISITLVFFALFGSMYFLTQYLQFVMGYSALQAGVRMLPVAAALMIVSPISATLVRWVGTKVPVFAGLSLAAVGLLIFSRTTVDSGYGLVLLTQVVLGAGMALAMTPATDSIMGSLPAERAGVGSAVNDTTREIGGALGVAVLGSITNSAYRDKVTGNADFATLQQAAPEAADAVLSSVGNAATVAAQLPADMAGLLVSAANNAFVDALDRTVVVGAAVAFAGALVALAFLPSRARVPAVSADEDLDKLDYEYDDLGDLEHLAATSAERLEPHGDWAWATLRRLADAGRSGLTFNAITTRAGIGTSTDGADKTARVDAIVDVMTTAFHDEPVSQTGEFRTDARIYLGNLAGTLAEPRVDEVIATLIAVAARDPELAAEFRAKLVGPRSDALTAMVEEAVARGELPPGRDPEVMADMLVGPLFHRLLITGDPITSEMIDAIVDAVAAPPLASARQ